MAETEKRRFKRLVGLGIQGGEGRKGELRGWVREWNPVFVLYDGCF